MRSRFALGDARRYPTPMATTADWIVSDPEILGGKPCVKGTRLSVEFLLELAASGATQVEMLASYPQLTSEGLAAAFLYAAQASQHGQTIGVEPTGAVLAEVLRLSRAERAEVAQALLNSLEEPEEEVTAAWAAELERRSRDVVDGRVETLSWEAVRSEILAELEQRRAGRASS